MPTPSETKDAGAAPLPQGARPDRATIALFVLTSRIDDGAADADLFATHAEASAAEAALARQHIDTYRSDYSQMIVDAGWRRKPAIESLTDAECVELANAWDGAIFETDVSSQSVTISTANIHPL